MSYYMGIMSGTSLDGVDIVLADIFPGNTKHPENFSFIAAQSYPVPVRLKQQLLALSQERHKNELDSYAHLDVQTGKLFAHCCQQLLKSQGVAAAKITAIGSHGQTLRHYPDTDYPTTLQIGDPNIIAQQCGITTIADFRRRDMASGGQGAPLVPPFHQAIFYSEKKNRVILNIGGIANITFLAAKGHLTTGYDTGPGNGLMDDWCLKHFNCPYDPDGQQAAKGQIHQYLLTQMLNDPYFSQAPPKSTGREYFSYQWIFKQLHNTGTEIDPSDVLRTLLELSCISIRNEINLLPEKIDEILVCGGGTRNLYLMHRLQELLPGSLIASTENYGLHPDWVEASAFAWLAYRTLNGLTGNLPSVTGADRKVILGAIWPVPHNPQD